MDRKEAIEVVRKKVDYYEADKRLKAALEALIPELAESEDEKTLEFMRDHFYNLVKLQDENERMYTKCLVFVTALTGQKAIQDSVVVVAANRPMISKFEAGKAAVLNNPEEYGLCKLAAWSEEDERMRKEIVDFIRWAVDRGSITKAQRERSDSWLTYLDKLKEKSEKPIIPGWSAGDERIRKNICRIVKEHMRHCAEAGIEIGDHREALQYLEKQKERKPVENTPIYVDAAKKYFDSWIEMHRDSPTKWGCFWEGILYSGKLHPAEWSEEDVPIEVEIPIIRK